jgi:regulator of protease activity HflC (stomatin/prohibitin superfamily)
MLLTPLTAGALLAYALICFGSAVAASNPAIKADLDVVGAATLIAAAGFLGAITLILSPAVLRKLATQPEVGSKPALQQRLIAAFSKRLLGKSDGLFLDGGLVKWLPVIGAAMASAIALLVMATQWSAVGQKATDISSLPLLGGVLIVASFPLIALERIYAAREEVHWPDAAHLQRLLRLPLLASVAIGATSLLQSLGYQWPAWMDRAVMVIIALVAIEIILRAFLQLFLPAPTGRIGRSVASHMAGLITPRWPGMDAFNRGVQRQLGIDLSRSWAASFLQRACLPVAAGLLLVGWLLTGLTTLAIDQRGIYERFGVPVEVDEPGLHFHLPWPFGIVRRVELGVVHEIPIVFQQPDSSGATKQDDEAADEKAEMVDAEAMPPRSVDRLWDDLHPSEASYLIASAENGHQGFEIVNIDLRLVYRVGLSDADAMAATYRVDDADALLRANAGRLLVQHFSQYTLADVLGDNRARFIGAFSQGLQKRLDDLHTGIDIVAVVVEAIHPPPAAARAYHNVQAAQVRAMARISQSRAGAFTEKGKAAQQAITALDKATAWSAEDTDKAQTTGTLFSADVAASHQAGDVFLRERWFDQLQRNLGHAPLLVVDDRLRGLDAPTIDLRRFVPSNATMPGVPAKK